MSKEKIVIGSRESRLAVLQSEQVKACIERENPGLSVEILTMKTTGDKILDRTLDAVGGKGLFVKELDCALLDGRSDLSVHSLKDVPMEISENLPLLAFSKREDPRDVLVLPAGVDFWDKTKPIGCASLRRSVQLKSLFPDVTVRPVRGNLQTRLKKLDEGQYGALVLAAAGLKRLGLENRISRYFTAEEMLPAAGQGILVVQGRAGEDYGYLKKFDAPEARDAALAERAFVTELGGGCSSPAAAYAVIDGENLWLRGLDYDEESQTILRASGCCPRTDAVSLGRKLAQELKHNARVARSIHQMQETPPPVLWLNHDFGSVSDSGQSGESNPEKDNLNGIRTDEGRPVGSRPGKVWLVGAGPGDIGLFTLKGMEVLKMADVVFYDSLVGQGVLSQIPVSAELVNVGKRASHHTMPQEEISRRLLEEAKKGRRVVRLKGGDPFLFGRGGEELELLAENGIPFEVVPGVTSPLAVPAYNGIPVTHRDFCSSLHIITGHKRVGKDYDIDFEALVRSGGTLVFLMGVTAMEDICEGLLKAGMSPDMPAALLEKGTTAGQKRIVATVSTLTAEAKRQGIATPAIILIGKVCVLADKFQWYEKLPLAGWKVLVTRPRNQISRTAAALREKGAEVLEIPAIRTEAIPPEESGPLRQALGDLRSYDWLVFTSPTGVEIFFAQMAAAGSDVRTLAQAKIAAIGEGTKKKLTERGLYPDLMPETYDGDSLGATLAAVLAGTERILIPRAEKGNENLVRLLSQTGAQVDDIATYRTIYETSPLIDEKQEFENGSIDCVVFTSASTVRGFVESTPGLDYTKVRAACIGKQTRAAADAYGMRTRMSEKATIDSLIGLVVRMREKARSDEKT